MAGTTSAVAGAPRAPDADLREEIHALHQKIDRLAEQIGFLHDRGRVVDELTTELNPIAKDAMAALSEELEKLQHEFNTDELVHLVRRTLQSTPRFVWMLDQAETLSGLIQEFTPIARELMSSGIEWLDQAERKGYFRLAKGASQMADQIGEHFSQKDIDALAANFATMMETLKLVTQPSVLALAASAVSAVQDLDKKPPTPLSAWGMFKAMGDPDIQKGLGLMMDVLRRVAHQATSPVLPAPAKSSAAQKQLNAK